MLSTQQKSMYLAGIIILLVILGALTWNTIRMNTQDPSREGDELSSAVLPTTPGPADDEDMIIEDPIENELIRDLRSTDFRFRANLEDVTAGEDVRGVNTNLQAAGVAYMDFSEEKKYQMLAEFDELPQPREDDFYEGWVVRTEPFAFISTGKLEKEGEVYINAFESNEDYSDYNRYVLTLEPNDGDPAPADHIVEGDFEDITLVK